MLRDIKLWELRLVRSLAIGGTLAESARELGLTQAAISQSVRRLELAVGAQIVKRRGRRLEFTLCGQIVLEYAQRLLAMQDEVLSDMSLWQDHRAAGRPRRRQEQGLEREMQSSLIADCTASKIAA